MHHKRFCLVYCCWQATYWSECTITSLNLKQYILLCSWNIQKQMVYYDIKNIYPLTALCRKHRAVKICLDLHKNCLPFTRIPWLWRSRGFHQLITFRCQKWQNFPRFEDVTLVLLKIHVAWDDTLHCWVSHSQCFDRSQYLHLQAVCLSLNLPHSTFSLIHTNKQTNKQTNKHINTACTC